MMRPLEIQIVPFDQLKDSSKRRETIANWIYNEFIHNIRSGITYEDIYNRFTGFRPDRLPIRYVALNLENGACVGTVSLVQNDLKCRDYGPWLSSLVVHQAYRNQGIGKQLIERVKDQAWSLTYEKLYLRTETAGGYYRKLGWLFLEQCVDEFGLEPEVFYWPK